MTPPPRPAAPDRPPHPIEARPMRPEKPVAAPYIVAREEEQYELAAKLTFYDDRLSWTDEDRRDRDEQGVLWGRRSHLPHREDGQPGGTPVLAGIHPRRQHECMTDLWCQVCRRNKASRTAAGWLFLLPHPGDDVPPTWPEGEPVDHPPVCLAGAQQSVRRCPNLRAWHVAVRVRVPRLYGVVGDVYRPTADGGAERVEDGVDLVIPYRHNGGPTRGLQYVLAHRLVRTLHGCTRIDLDAELAR